MWVQPTDIHIIMSVVQPIAMYKYLYTALVQPTEVQYVGQWFNRSRHHRPSGQWSPSALAGING